MPRAIPSCSTNERYAAAFLSGPAKCTRRIGCTEHVCDAPRLYSLTPARSRPLRLSENEVRTSRSIDHLA